MNGLFQALKSVCDKSVFHFTAAMWLFSCVYEDGAAAASTAYLLQKQIVASYRQRSTDNV